jgi:hypothetical protein
VVAPDSLGLSVSSPNNFVPMSIIVWEKDGEPKLSKYRGSKTLPRRGIMVGGVLMPENPRNYSWCQSAAGKLVRELPMISNG